MPAPTTPTHPLPPHDGDGGPSSEADRASLVRAKAWRAELVQLLLRQGKEPSAECCVCLEPLESPGLDAGAPVFVFQDCYHQIHGKCVKAVATNRTVAPADMRSAFQPPPCPLCRSGSGP